MAKQPLILTLLVDADINELRTELAGTVPVSGVNSPDLGKAGACVSTYMNGLINGALRTPGTQFSVTIGGPGAAVAATRTVAVTFANLVAGDVLVIGQRQFIAVAGTPGANQFQLDTDSATTATSLRASINADTLCLAAATGAAANVIVTAKSTGKAGNDIQLVTNKPTGLTFTGRALAGGVDAAVTYTLLT